MRIHYCYRTYQPLINEIKPNVPNFTSKQGLPSSGELDEFTTESRHKLIAIDNLMHRVVQDKEMELLFTQGTHHKCMGVILIIQNLYHEENTAGPWYIRSEVIPAQRKGVPKIIIWKAQGVPQ